MWSEVSTASNGRAAATDREEEEVAGTGGSCAGCKALKGHEAPGYRDKGCMACRGGDRKLFIVGKPWT